MPASNYKKSIRSTLNKRTSAETAASVFKVIVVLIVIIVVGFLILHAVNDAKSQLTGVE